MTNSVLKQAIVISVMGHMALFSLFSLSFGPKIPKVNFAHVYFWGNVLHSYDLMSIRDLNIGHKIGRFTAKSEISALDKISRDNLLASRGNFSSEAGSRFISSYDWREKPPVSLEFNQEKIVFTQKLVPAPLMIGRKETGIIFYPRLPYQFALYFKDRQNVHIELMFEVISGEKRNSVLVKRRISSGNLEVDLLSMRYISRYLFMQQRAFVPNKWQTVKIDLSTAND